MYCQFTTYFKISFIGKFHPVLRSIFCASQFQCIDVFQKVQTFEK